MMETFKFEKNDTFHKYILEDKSDYKTATEAGFIDKDNMFLVGKSGGFLMNIDFTFINTHLFSEAARDFVTLGRKYIDQDVDTPAYTKFRRQEEHRRRYGLTRKCKLTKDGKIEDLHITGEHYNFLNYVEIYRLDYESIEGSTGKKKFGFPRLFDSQFWYYKCKAFSEINGMHMIVNKTRRAGFTYMEGKGCANDVNLNPRSVSLLVAWDKKYITTGNTIAPMALDQLSFYENYTPFKRGILSRNIEDVELGYKNKNGDKEGFRSRIVSVSTFNNPDAAIGKDAQKIKVEELGNMPNFDAFMRQTEPTTRTGSFTTGHITAFGTVNSNNETNDIFEKNFYNPRAWNFMPFENVWDVDSRDNVCGFFKPFWWGLEGTDEFGNFAMDKDGNTNYEVAMRVVEDERKFQWDNKKTLKDYIDYCGQYANDPSEAFNHGSSNMFASKELDDHILAVKSQEAFKFYRDGSIINEDGDFNFVSNDRLYQQGKEFHPFVEESRLDPDKDVHGCFRQFYAPIKPSKQLPDNLYRVWVDSFAVDKDEFDVKNSFGAIYVYLRLNSLGIQAGDMLVGVYVGRTNKQEEFDKIAYNITRYYNAKVMFENDRGQILQDFRAWKCLNLLETEPTFAWDKNVKSTGSGRVYGVSMGSGGRKLTALLLFKEWLYTKRGVREDGTPVYNLHYIYDLPTLLEIKRWKPKGNFDRLSALLVGMFDLKELSILNKPAGTTKTRNRDSVFSREWFTNN